MNADQTSFVKLVVHRCHVNKYNAYNQVGLIAINCLGVSDSVVGNVSVEGYRSSGHQVPGNSSSGKTGGRAGGAGGARRYEVARSEATSWECDNCLRNSSALVAFRLTLKSLSFAT